MRMSSLKPTSDWRELATQVAIAYENAMLYSDAQRTRHELQQEITERKQAEKSAPSC